VTSLSHEIDDVPILKVGKVQLNGFLRPQAGGEQLSQPRWVTLYQ
jgi:hypothetical protein